MISALVLAAGASRRFGATKLVQQVEGKAVIRWTVETLLEAPVDEIVVVVAPGAASIRAALQGVPVRFAENARAEEGMGGSIACGVRAAAPETSAVIVVLGDEPMLSAAAIGSVVDRHHDAGSQIVVPTYDGVRGHPVLFDRAVFLELERLTGDRGARDVVDRDAARVTYVELSTARPVDVDTPADLALVRQRAQNTVPVSARRQ